MLKEKHTHLSNKLIFPVLDSNLNPTGQTSSITEPTNLFAAITAQNISNFSQAMDTPGVSGTLGDNYSSNHKE